MYPLTAILSSAAALIANNKSGRVVNPTAAIRIFHATSAEASSKLFAIVVARVYATGVLLLGGTTIGLPYLSLLISTAGITSPSPIDEAG
jgi:hypothetical protein